MATKKVGEKSGTPLFQSKAPVRFAKGGVTTMQRKELGRGMAKVANQKSSSFGKGQQ